MYSGHAIVQGMMPDKFGSTAILRHDDQKAWLAMLALLEVLERFGTVRWAGGKGIPFPPARSFYNPSNRKPLLAKLTTAKAKKSLSRR